MKETASQANETSDGTPPRTPADLDYCLPDDLIAQRPLAQRDASRMLCVDRRVNGLIDARITDLPTHLNRGDLLVLNDTKVLPAKLATRRETGGRIDGLFERETRPGEWVVMLTGSRRLRCGERLLVGDCADDPVYLRLVEAPGGGRWPGQGGGRAAPTRRCCRGGGGGGNAGGTHGVSGAGLVPASIKPNGATRW